MNIAIIGAGLTGLTTAYELHKHRPDATITVFEAADRIGGKLYTVPFSVGPTDMGAEAYLAKRQDATEFFEELGLGESLREPSGLPSMVYAGGALHALPTDTIMGIPARLAALGGLVDDIDAAADDQPLAWGAQDRNLGALVRERFGDQVADRVVSALLGGVYSSSCDDLGVRATLPQLAAVLDAMAESGQPLTLGGAVATLLEKHNAPRGYRPSVFRTFAGGYAELYEALAEQSGAQIHIDAFITGITRTTHGFTLTGAEGTFDEVVLATPAPTTAMLIKGIAPTAAAELKTIALASSVVVGMRFADAAGLPDYSGILVGAGEQDVKAKAFTFSSKKWPHLDREGGALVRASFGRYGDDALTRAEEDDLVDYALDDLQTITGFDGRAAGLEEIFVQRWFGGLPVYAPGHNDKVARILTALADEAEHLHVTGAWVDGVGVPAVIANARAVARTIAGVGVA